MQAFPKSLGTVVIIFFPTEQGKRFKGYSVASTVASYVAVVEAGPYLTSVDIRPNTLCKGGSIKTTLYDPCFRSTTVVQGFPAVNSFLYRKSRNSLPVIVSGCKSGGPSPLVRVQSGMQGGLVPPETLGRLSFLDRSVYTYTFSQQECDVYVRFSPKFFYSSPYPQTSRIFPETSKGGELPASMDCPFHYGLLLFTRHCSSYTQHIHSTRPNTVQYDYDYELVDLL